MKKLLVSIALAISIATTAKATDPKAEAAAQKVAESAFLLVGVTYLCSDAVGNAHFYAARMQAEAAIKGLGETDDSAVITVDDFAERAKKENPKKAPSANAPKCMDAILGAQSDLKVSEARFRKVMADLKDTNQ